MPRLVVPPSEARRRGFTQLKNQSGNRRIFRSETAAKKSARGLNKRLKSKNFLVTSAVKDGVRSWFVVSRPRRRSS